MIDDSLLRATPLAPAPLPLLSLAGGPLDARLPLALLEAVKAIDTPEAELDAELVHELRNKRLGLSETVLLQIRRYQDAVRRQQRVPFDEVLALARLIGRRPDADLAFREAGRRGSRRGVHDRFHEPQCRHDLASAVRPADRVAPTPEGCPSFHGREARATGQCAAA